MDDALRERVEALERAVTDGDHDLSAFADEAAALERLETLESNLEEMEDRVEELEAATQALRGYVGNVRSVNTDVEQRADAALAKAESLEAAMADAQPTDGPSIARGADDTADATDSATVRDGSVTDPATARNGSVDAGMDRPDEGIDVATTEKSGGRTDAIGTARSTGRSETATTTIDLGTDGADRTIRGTGDSIGTGHGHDVDRWQTDAPTTTDGPGDSEPAREDDRRCQACGRPHTAGDASDDGRETSSSTSIRRETDTTPDEDVVPDGETDPFVATADESGTEAGTLERIRDLL